MAAAPDDEVATPAGELAAAEDDAPRNDRPRRAKHIVAVGGGKGGVGKSLLAANVAIYLAQIGKRVVLLDANLGGANLHTFLGIERPRLTLGDFLARRVARVDDIVVETSISGLGLVCGEGEPLWAANPRPAQKHRLLTQARELDVDYLIIDLAPGSGFNAIDFFLLADAGLLVAVPEPTAIENTFRFIKSAFLRKLRGAPGLDKVLTAVTEEGCEGGIPAPLDLHQSAERLGDAPLAARLLEEIDAFRPRLVVNQARTRADHELAPALRSAGRRRLGLALDHLGALEFDDAVWLAVRKRRPLVVEYPESRVAKNIERVVRRLLTIDGERSGPTPARPRPTEVQTHYEVLEVDAGATDEDVRRAFRRAREIYAVESMVTSGLYSAARLGVLQKRIEEAYDALIDPDRRRAYDVATFPEGHPVERQSRPKEAPGPALAAMAAGGEPAMRAAAAGPAPEIGEETEVTGALLRQLREARGVDLQDIAHRSKVSARYLRAIEEENFAQLPAVVYVRGWLTEYARVLRADPQRVTRSYLARMSAARGAEEK